MSPDSVEEAVDVLQRLGLKAYEARCFVALTRLSTATAKDISEVTEVPRTRVYDAVRNLEVQGFVEVQHTSPKQFRAVPLQEAIETLRDQYEARLQQLEDDLREAEPLELDDGVEEPLEVWTMTGTTPIANRTQRVIEDATEEVVLVLGDTSLLTEDLVDSLSAHSAEVDLLVGTLTEPLQQHVQDAVPGAETFVSGLEWLRNDATNTDEVAIGRLLLVDRSTILASTVDPVSSDEYAVYGGGFRNGLVVIVRRLMAHGLLANRDPGHE